MTFTIQQISLSRLPTKKDPNVVNVIWAADVILVNVSQIDFSHLPLTS